MAEGKPGTRRSGSASKPKAGNGGGRRFTQRKPLAAKDEKKLDAVTKAFESSSEIVKARAAQYGRKVLKHQAGLRATPAPIPAELGAENAKKVRAALGISESAAPANGGKAKASGGKAATSGKAAAAAPAAEGAADAK